eukprot:712479-Pyramimonas_sp.AAC.1
MAGLSQRNPRASCPMVWRCFRLCLRGSAWVTTGASCWSAAGPPLGLPSTLARFFASWPMRSWDRR